jgi:CRP-like cAMP-binding protein
MWQQIPDLLAGLSDEDAARVLALGGRVTISGGSELFRLGDEADRIFLIRRGRIRLTLPMQVRGQPESILLEECAAGQTVGWSALIPPYRFTLTATAPLETELIALSREALNELLRSTPDLGYAVSRNLAGLIGQRLQIFQTMWVREMQRSVELRCA